MSIWSTTLELELPSRDEYGREDDALDERPRWTQHPRARIEIATSPRMSSVIRLDLVEIENAEAQALITPTEARQLAQALTDAATAYD